MHPQRFSIPIHPQKDSDAVFCRLRYNICVHENRIVRTFFSTGDDIEPTYQRIENGKWLSDSAFDVVHHLASK